MKVEYALPCRGVEALQNGQFVLVGVETNLWMVPELPVILLVHLFVCVSQGHTETDPADLRVRILNPGLEPCADDLSAPITSVRSPLLPDGWASRTNIPMELGFEATAFGAYSVEVSCGSSFVSVPYLVIESPATA